MSKDERLQQSAFICRRNRHFNGDNQSPIKPVSLESDTGQNLASVLKLTAGDPFLGSMTERLAQEIHDEFLVCKICLESYTDPKCLACLHTFCANCIEKHIFAEVTYNKYTDYRDFTCPLCRKRTQLPLGGVKRLPDNFLISGLSELVLRQRSQSIASSTTTLATPVIRIDRNDAFSSENIDSLHQLPHLDKRSSTANIYGECEICSQVVGQTDRGHSIEPNSTKSQQDAGQRASSASLSKTPKASHKCLDCNKLLCTDCVQKHCNMKVTKNHAIFELQLHNNIECREHPGESVRFYCNVCSACICVLCTFNAHREHEVTSFGEAVNKLRGELSSQMEVAHEQLTNGQHCLEKIEQGTNLVHQIEKQIIDTAEHFVNQIEHTKQQLLNELHSFVGQHNMRLINQHADHETQFEMAKVLFDNVSNHLKGQDMDLLIVKADLYEKLNELNELTLIDDRLDDFWTDVYFQPGSVQLGYLTHDAGEMNKRFDQMSPTPYSYQTSHNSSVSSSSVELANRPCINSVGCQTEISLLDNLHNPKSITPPPPPPPPPEPKQVRSRACFTEPIHMVDCETNTRPRGVNTIITYSDILSTTPSQEYLAKLDMDKLNFDTMDNLTRARIRRKLNERHHTIDPISNGVYHNNATDNGIQTTCGAVVRPTNGNSDYSARRYSSYDKRYHH